METRFYRISSPTPLFKDLLPPPYPPTSRCIRTPSPKGRWGRIRGRWGRIRGRWGRIRLPSPNRPIRVPPSQRTLGAHQYPFSNRPVRAPPSQRTLGAHQTPLPQQTGTSTPFPKDARGASDFPPPTDRYKQPPL
jgi:hypothetical protein